MEEKPTFIEPYKASLLHKIYDWIDRLPAPYWLFSVALLVIAGALNNLVAWNNNVLPAGKINWDFAFTGFFLCYYLFAVDFLIRLAKTSLLEFRHTLNIGEVEFEKILFEFTRLPARNTLVIFNLFVANRARNELFISTVGSAYVFPFGRYGINCFIPVDSNIEIDKPII